MTDLAKWAIHVGIEFIAIKIVIFECIKIQQ